MSSKYLLQFLVLWGVQQYRILKNYLYMIQEHKNRTVYSFKVWIILYSYKVRILPIQKSVCVCVFLSKLEISCPKFLWDWAQGQQAHHLLWFSTYIMYLSQNFPKTLFPAVGSRYVLINGYHCFCQVFLEFLLARSSEDVGQKNYFGHSEVFFILEYPG